MENDPAVLAPTTSGGVHGIGKIGDASRLQFNSLEPPIGEKRDVFAVGRKEWIESGLSPGERVNRGLIESAPIQQNLSLGVARRIHDACGIRRNRKGGAVIGEQRDPRSQVNGYKNKRRTSRGQERVEAASPRSPGEQCSCQGENCGESPE